MLQIQFNSLTNQIQIGNETLSKEDLKGVISDDAINLFFALAEKKFTPGNGLNSIGIDGYGLSLPDGDVDVSAFLALPSPGAALLALVTEANAESKKMSQQLAFEKGLQAVDKMKEEAESIRSNAIVQCAMGCASGLVSIGSGVAGGCLATGAGPLLKTTNAGGEVVQKYSTQQLSALSTSVTTSIGGLTRVNDSIAGMLNSFASAEQKEMQAEAEMFRNLRDSLKSLVDNYNQVIAKALSTTDSLQQSTNQARTKIMG